MSQILSGDSRGIRMALTGKQKYDLETKAVQAFGGSSKRDLINGFRIMSAAGPQVAAVYWSDNHPGNDVEVAVCDSRINPRLGPGTVQQWLDYEISISGRACNTHKHGSDWPIIGFSYGAALDAFFTRCLSMRRGFPQQSLMDAIPNNAKGASAVQADTAPLREILASLRPHRAEMVISLVRRAGGCWTFRADWCALEEKRLANQ